MSDRSTQTKQLTSAELQRLRAARALVDSIRRTGPNYAVGRAMPMPRVAIPASLVAGLRELVDQQAANEAEVERRFVRAMRNLRTKL